MSPTKALLLSLALGPLGACYGPIDEVSICILPSSDRAVVRASAGCAADHKGARISCSISKTGMQLEVSIDGREGKDPDDACKGDLQTTCESEPLADGEYTLHFGDQELPLTIPNESAFCSDTTTGGT
jgi:hypothetical protein